MLLASLNGYLFQLILLGGGILSCFGSLALEALRRHLQTGQGPRDLVDEDGKYYLKLKLGFGELV